MSSQEGCQAEMKARKDDLIRESRSEEREREREKAREREE